MFLQVLSERELAPGETWSFSLQGILEVQPGEYEAVASVGSSLAPSQARTHFVVE